MYQKIQYVKMEMLINDFKVKNRKIYGDKTIL